MPRYRQIQNEDGSYSLVEVGPATGPRSFDLHVQREITPFRSVVDGSIITNHADLAAHNKRNDVVHESEWGTADERKAFYDRKERERADFYNGTTHTHYGQKLKKERVADIVDAIRQSEAKELRNE